LTNISSINKTVFIGTPDFSVPTLLKLSETNYKPLLVITQPDKPQGRKLKLVPTPVKQTAEQLGIKVIQPEKIKEEDVIRKLIEINPDVIITVAYGGFLTKKILDLPSFGCLNIHPSLLPKYRGATPINHALFEGEKETGVTITKMTLKMDSGPILQQKIVTIEKEDNYSSLSAKLAEIGADELIDVLQKLEKHEIIAIPQNDEEATYCYKLQKDDLYLDWNEKATDIHNKIRGLAEEPGAMTTFRGNKMKILATKILQERADLLPGKVSAILKNEGIVVCCRDQKILLTKVQPAGKRIMSGFEYHIGARIEIGENFVSGIRDRS